MEYECRSLSSSKLATSIEEDKCVTYSSPELKLAIAMLQQDGKQFSGVLRPESNPDSTLLLQQLLSQAKQCPDMPVSKELARLQNKLLDNHVVLRPEPLWSASSGLSSMKPISLFNTSTSVLSYVEPLNVAGKGRVHGKRGRPLGSVGRRKLLEQSQERLRNELRGEMTKAMTSERQTHIEQIKKMVGDNETRLRALNETKSSGPRSGEKRDVASLSPPTTVPIAPKPSDMYPGIVQSPCKQQKLDMSETKIEPVYNMLAASHYSSPSYNETAPLTMLPKSSPLISSSFSTSPHHANSPPTPPPPTPPTPPPTTRYTTPSPPISAAQPTTIGSTDSTQRVMVEQLLNPLSPILNQWPLTSLDPMSLVGLEAAASLILRMRGDKATMEIKKCLSCCVEMSPLSTVMMCEMCTLLRTLFLRQNLMANQQQRAAQELLERLKGKSNSS